MDTPEIGDTDERPWRRLLRREAMGTLWVFGAAALWVALGESPEMRPTLPCFGLFVGCLALSSVAVYGLRSFGAWMVCAGGALALAWWLPHTTTVGAAALSRRVAGLWIAGVVGTALVALTPYATGFWRRCGWAACAQRWVAAIAATVATWLLSLAWVTGTEAWDSFFRWATPLAALLTIGVMTERRLGGWGRPLSALGAASLCAYAALVCLLLEQSAFGGSWTTVEDWELAISAMVAPVVARWAVRDEGLFLLLIPGISWAVHQDRMVVGIGVLAAVGLTVAVQGAITHTWSRAYAGFALASLASLIGFAH